MMELKTQETVNGVVSYGLGCASIALGWICEATDFWQALAMFLGVLLVIIRIAHDGYRFYRDVKNGK